MGSLNLWQHCTMVTVSQKSWLTIQMGSGSVVKILARVINIPIDDNLRQAAFRVPMGESVTRCDANGSGLDELLGCYACISRHHPPLFRYRDPELTTIACIWPAFSTDVWSQLKELQWPCWWSTTGWTLKQSSKVQLAFKPACEAISEKRS